jgi:hypothetical protein
LCVGDAGPLVQYTCARTCDMYMYTHVYTGVMPGSALNAIREKINIW